MTFFQKLGFGKSSNSPVPSRGNEFETFFYGRLLEYGRTSDEKMESEITPLYLRANSQIPRETRMAMLMRIIDKVENKHISGNAILPFIFRDIDPQIVSTATLHAAEFWPSNPGDPFTGIRELLGYARRNMQLDDEPRSIAIISGIVLLGDRRVLSIAGPCWRILSPKGRKELPSGIL